MTGAAFPTTNGCFRRTSVYVTLSPVTLALIIIFLLGIGNFAIHRAVLESGHQLIEQLPGFASLFGGRLTLVAEFLVLFAALFLAANGWSGIAWAYGVYTGLNVGTAWLILTGRI